MMYLEYINLLPPHEKEFLDKFISEEEKEDFLIKLFNMYRGGTAYYLLETYMRDHSSHKYTLEQCIEQVNKDYIYAIKFKDNNTLVAKHNLPRISSTLEKEEDKTEDKIIEVKNVSINDMLSSINKLEESAVEKDGKILKGWAKICNIGENQLHEKLIGPPGTSSDFLVDEVFDIPRFKTYKELKFYNNLGLSDDEFQEFIANRASYRSDIQSIVASDMLLNKREVEYYSKPKEIDLPSSLKDGRDKTEADIFKTFGTLQFNQGDKLEVTASNYKEYILQMYYIIAPHLRELKLSDKNIRRQLYILERILGFEDEDCEKFIKIPDSTIDKDRFLKVLQNASTERDISISEKQLTNPNVWTKETIGEYVVSDSVNIPLSTSLMGLLDTLRCDLNHTLHSGQITEDEADVLNLSQLMYKIEDMMTKRRLDIYFRDHLIAFGNKIKAFSNTNKITLLSNWKHGEPLFDLLIKRIELERDENLDYLTRKSRFDIKLPGYSEPEKPVFHTIQGKEENMELQEINKNVLGRNYKYKKVIPQEIIDRYPNYFKLTRVEKAELFAQMVNDLDPGRATGVASWEAYKDKRTNDFYSMSSIMDEADNNLYVAEQIKAARFYYEKLKEQKPLLDDIEEDEKSDDKSSILNYKEPHPCAPEFEIDPITGNSLQQEWKLRREYKWNDHIEFLNRYLTETTDSPPTFIGVDQVVRWKDNSLPIKLDRRDIDPGTPDKFELILDKDNTIIDATLGAEWVYTGVKYDPDKSEFKFDKRHNLENIIQVRAEFHRIREEEREKNFNYEIDLSDIAAKSNDKAPEKKEELGVKPSLANNLANKFDKKEVNEVLPFHKLNGKPEKKRSTLFKSETTPDEIAEKLKEFNDSELDLDQLNVKYKGKIPKDILNKKSKDILKKEAENVTEEEKEIFEEFDKMNSKEDEFEIPQMQFKSNIPDFTGNQEVDKMIKSGELKPSHELLETVHEMDPVAKAIYEATPDVKMVKNEKEMGDKNMGALDKMLYQQQNPGSVTMEQQNKNMQTHPQTEFVKTALTERLMQTAEKLGFDSEAMLEESIAKAKEARAKYEAEQAAKQNNNLGGNNMMNNMNMGMNNNMGQTLGSQTTLRPLGAGNGSPMKMGFNNALDPNKMNNKINQMNNNLGGNNMMNNMNNTMNMGINNNMGNQMNQQGNNMLNQNTAGTSGFKGFNNIGQNQMMNGFNQMNNNVQNNQMNNNLGGNNMNNTMNMGINNNMGNQMGQMNNGFTNQQFGMNQGFKGFNNMGNQMNQQQQSVVDSMWGKQNNNLGGNNMMNNMNMGNQINQVNVKMECGIDVSTINDTDLEVMRFSAFKIAEKALDNFVTQQGVSPHIIKSVFGGTYTDTLKGLIIEYLRTKTIDNSIVQIAREAFNHKIQQNQMNAQMNNMNQGFMNNGFANQQFGMNQGFGGFGQPNQMMNGFNNMNNGFTNQMNQQMNQSFGNRFGMNNQMNNGFGGFGMNQMNPMMNGFNNMNNGFTNQMNQQSPMAQFGQQWMARMNNGFGGFGNQMGNQMNQGFMNNTMQGTSTLGGVFGNQMGQMNNGFGGFGQPNQMMNGFSGFNRPGVPGVQGNRVNFGGFGMNQMGQMNNGFGGFGQPNPMMNGFNNNPFGAQMGF